MRRELSAERRAHSPSLSRFGSLAQRIRSGKSAGKKIDRKKLASFGPLCLSSDSTRCQESESPIELEIRRRVRLQLDLPFWTLYFRHYEVGAPCRSGHVWYALLCLHRLCIARNASSACLFIPPNPTIRRMMSSGKRANWLIA